MIARIHKASLLLLVALCATCDEDQTSEPPRGQSSALLEALDGDVFSRPMSGLPESASARFFVGNSFFNQNWVSAPSTVATRDGLGPLFNARSCSGCHFKDGRGQPPAPGEPIRSMLVRISIPGRGPYGAPLPDPRYGDQLQGDAVSGVAREADVLVRQHAEPGAFADGEPYELERPALQIESLGHGPVSEGLQTSLRVAPALVGMGLLEAIVESDLLHRVDSHDRDRDGISGRANLVFSPSVNSVQLGRFGWKAEQATLLDQTAAAFVGDMGITSHLHPLENHTDLQRACADSTSGGSPELTDDVLYAVTSYLRTLAVPPPKDLNQPEVRRGAAIFSETGCASCHVASWTTGPDAEPSVLAARTIYPYTDLLLHDMGPGLADGRPSFDASGSEWRTAPLWGVGRVQQVNGHTRFLHDGRARNLSEAILWHGGEAERARTAYLRMPREDRLALLSFLESL